jgi:hypothetical protein
LQSDIQHDQLHETRDEMSDKIKVLFSMYPLQLIREPMALDSRQLNFARYLAASVHPPNLPVKARVQIATVYAQVMPSSNNCRLVFRPDRVKYWKHIVSNGNGEE